MLRKKTYGLLTFAAVLFLAACSNPIQKVQSADDSAQAKAVTALAASAGDKAVEIAAPLNGSKVLVGAVVQIVANVVPADDVKKVNFLIDGVQIDSDNTAPYVTYWVVPAISGESQNFTITAKAVYNSGPPAATDQITVTAVTTMADNDIQIHYLSSVYPTFIKYSLDGGVTFKQELMAGSVYPGYKFSKKLASAMICQFIQGSVVDDNLGANYQIYVPGVYTIANHSVSPGVPNYDTRVAVIYRTDSLVEFMSYNPNHTEWTSDPGVRMEDYAYASYKFKVVDALNLQAKFTPDGSTWDDNGGLNYTFGLPGIYTLDNGVVMPGLPAQPDFTKPDVTITNPTNKAFLKGTVAVSADAFDDIGVTKVVFVLNGTVLDTVTAAPYTTSWPTKNGSYPDGVYTLRARAFDAVGNVGVQTIKVTVDNTKPVVAIDTPATGDLLVPTTIVQSTATDAGGVANVEYSYSPVGGGSVWTLIGTATDYPYQLDWNTTGLLSGKYRLRAIATDLAGNKSAASIVTPLIKP